MRRLFYLYKRIMWYFSVFLSEVDGFLQIIKYVGLATIAFATIGIVISLINMIITGVVIFIVGVSAGIILVKSGAVQITQDLNNSQNDMLKEIVKKLSP